MPSDVAMKAAREWLSVPEPMDGVHVSQYHKTATGYLPIEYEGEYVNGLAEALDAFAAQAVAAERARWVAHAFSDNRKCSHCSSVALANKHPFTVCDDCWGVVPRSEPWPKQ